MRSLTNYVVLGMLLVAGSLAQAQQAADPSASASSGASKAEVNELRKQVAEQQKTIEQLKAVVQKLAENSSQAGNAVSSSIQPVAETTPVSANPAEGTGSAPHLVNTVLVQPDPAAIAVAVDQAAPAAPKKDAGPPLTAG
jgi:uncharacterized coiled-coil protein SlyX